MPETEPGAPKRSLTRSAAGTAAFAIVPITMGALIPLALSDWKSDWSAAIPRVVGFALAAAGALVVLDSFIRFAREGRGTPSPSAPTEDLVIGGLYRFVRNPMYVGVASAIIGQALILGSLAVAVYAAAFVATVTAFVVSYEEPTLREQFGSSYEAYLSGVPRWIPRLTPWRGPETRP